MNIDAYVKNISITDTDRDALQKIAYTNEIEYRGPVSKMNVYAGYSTEPGKLKVGNVEHNSQDYFIFINIHKSLIDSENTAYVTPPKREFKTKNNKSVSNGKIEIINAIYDKLQYDLTLQRHERMAALEGTVICRPIYDKATDTWDMQELLPSNESLTLDSHPAFPSKIMGIGYKYKTNITPVENSGVIEYLQEPVEMSIKWTSTTVNYKWSDTKGTHDITQDHNYGRLPFAILRFDLDRTRTWGAPDIELYTLAHQRNLILANALARTHLSQLEKLIVAGTSKEEVLDQMSSRLLALDAREITRSDGTQETIIPTAKYISPEADDAMKLLRTYTELLNNVKDNRGHVQKIFSRGADVPSAESIRLGSVELSNSQLSKKKYLINYEKDLFDIIVKEYEVSGGGQLGDIKIVVDFQPDPYAFANATDEVSYFTTAIKYGVETATDWVMYRKQLDQEDAEQRVKDNLEKLQESNKSPDALVDKQVDKQVDNNISE